MVLARAHAQIGVADTVTHSTLETRGIQSMQWHRGEGDCNSAIAHGRVENDVGGAHTLCLCVVAL